MKLSDKKENLKLCLCCSGFYYGKAKPSLRRPNALACPDCYTFDLSLSNKARPAIGFKRQLQVDHCPTCNYMVYTSSSGNNYSETIKYFSIKQNKELVIKYATGFSCTKCGTLTYLTFPDVDEFPLKTWEEIMIKMALSRLSETCNICDKELIFMKMDNFSYAKTNGVLYLKDITYTIYSWCMFCRKEFIFDSRSFNWHNPRLVAFS